MIFVVDDESVTAETLRLILSKSGFDVCSFSEPDRALAAATLQLPSHLITDVQMSPMDGFELANSVLRTVPTCTIIIMSGHLDLQRMRKEGETNWRYLEKPFHPDALLRKLGMRTPADPGEEILTTGRRPSGKMAAGQLCRYIASSTAMMSSSSDLLMNQAEYDSIHRPFAFAL